MGLLKPLYLLSVPILFSLTLPLAFFAALTTTCACTVLLFRLLVIYSEIGFALITHYIGKSSRPPIFLVPAFAAEEDQEAITTYVSRSGSSSVSSSTASNNGRYRRKRKASLPSISPPITIDTRVVQNNAPFALPISTTPLGQRDFEGVGGWRLDSAPEDTDQFTSINSRLELPGIVGGIKEHNRARNHRRRATSGSLPIGIAAYNSVVNGKNRHSSTSLDLKGTHGGSFNGILGASSGNVYPNDQRRPNPKLGNECPSPNTSRVRAPAGLAVTPLTSPEINRLIAKPQRRPPVTRSISEDYFSGIQYEGVGDGVGTKKRSSVVMHIEDASGNRLSSSSASSRGSECSEGLNMKGKP